VCLFWPFSAVHDSMGCLYYIGASYKPALTSRSCFARTRGTAPGCACPATATSDEQKRPRRRHHPAAVQVQIVHMRGAELDDDHGARLGIMACPALQAVEIGFSLYMV
jgi:hypothetical protein